jgi:hypothetical protein
VPWLILACYLLAAAALTWRLWADPAGRVQTGDTADVDLFAWFLRYDATAVAHGHLPALITTAMNAPRGVSVMWNTSLLLPGVVLAPVTLLAGPQVSLTVLLTLGYAGSAASLFFVLRRWGASLGAAALGGAVYGFSPALVNSGIGHYHLQFAVLPPLMIHALLRLVTGRAKPVWGVVRAGAWLGLLVAAQVFIGEELLADTALAALVLLVTLAASRPRAVTGRVRDVGLGVATGIVVALVICGHALLVQFFGPLTQHNHPAGPDPFTNRLSFLVSPPGNVLLHTQASAATAAAYSRGLGEYLGYLGWPLLILLPLAAIRFWPDLRVRTAAVGWAVLEVLSLGGGTLGSSGLRVPAWLLPFHWLQGAPVFSQVLPDRLSILADGAAAALLAFSFDLARAPAQQQAAAGRGWAFPKPVVAAVAAIAVVPLIPAPFSVASVPAVPAGWQTAFARLELAPGTRVLIVPVPSGRLPQVEVMRWQAVTGEPATMIGGFFVGPDKTGQQRIYIPGPTTTAAEYLDSLWDQRQHAGPLAHGLMRSVLSYWRPAAVIAVTSRDSLLGRYLTYLLGQPSFAVGAVLAWRLTPGHGHDPGRRLSRGSRLASGDHALYARHALALEA